MTPILRASHPTRWIAWGVGLLSLLLCLGLGMIWLQSVNTAIVVRTVEVNDRLASVLSSLQDAETGSRGYDLTGRAEFLEPYRDALARLGPALDALGVATAGDPEQRAALARLRVLTAEKMADVAGTVALRGATGVTAELVRPGPA